MVVVIYIKQITDLKEEIGNNSRGLQYPAFNHAKRKLIGICWA